MKKQYFISLFITCAVIFNVNAQNTPIDEFLKKYPSIEGMTNVLMSQQMLRSFFTNDPRRVPNTHSTTTSSSSQQQGGGEPFTITVRVQPQDGEAITHPITVQSLSRQARADGSVIIVDGSGRRQNIKIPEAYGSINVSNPGVPEIWFTDFKTMLVSSKYEPILEVTGKNNNRGYYVKKLNDNLSEVVVLRQQKDQFSAIYLKGEIEIDIIDTYLTIIRDGLSQISSF